MQNVTTETKILILGMGRSGKSVARYCLSQGITPVAYDAKAHLLSSHNDIKPLLEEGVKIFDDFVAPLSSQYDLAVASPGFPTSHPLCEGLRQRGIPIVGEVAFACRYLHIPILAVTGTNGKTTTTLLTTHILQESGLNVRGVGNVGIPLSEVLCEHNETNQLDCLVVELSSYQLEDLQNKTLDAAVILNIAPDHLDRYDSFDHYARTKLHIAKCLKPKAPFFISRSIAEDYKEEIARLSIDVNVFDSASDKRIMALNETLKAPHDRQNFLAAQALCRHMGLHDDTIDAAAATFNKPSHRLQLVGRVGNVFFYDDSKATNVSAVESAIDALEGDVYLIAGGAAKGQSFQSWRQSLVPKVKAMFLIGKDKNLLQQEIGDIIPVTLCDTLEEAVDSAYRAAGKRGIVLLSPGCASTDMFEDYTKRGMAFQKKVRHLTSN